MSRLHRPLLSQLSLLRAQKLPNWVCASCRRDIFSSAQPPKPFYVTSPIFYVNAAPHVGHLYSMVLADVVKRWELLRGNKAVLSIGTDEHGLKVQKAAQKAEVQPLEFCDSGANVFKDLAQRGLISYDFFARTTDHKHKNAVQYAWIRLKEQGYIYESEHEGWYSVSDETFVPESSIVLAVDPVTGKKKQVSEETGNVVEWTSEVNYRFRLSAFQDRLLQFYKDNPEWIIPQSRMDEVIREVRAGLSDLSISRPSDRVQWGIPVPDDHTQTIYVWLDALLNYAVQTGYPAGAMYQNGWPADLHIIGKDILRFHCIYWPAFLLALELPLPKRVLSHAHWTIGHTKMSKSLGNVVNPFHAMDAYSVDVIRWYLAHDGGITNDSDYHNLRIVERYRQLRGGLGNFTTRVVRGKKWSVPAAVQEAWGPNEGEVRKLIETHSDHKQMWEALCALEGNIASCLDRYDVRSALMQIMNVISKANDHFHNSAPWSEPVPTCRTQMSPTVSSTVGLAAEVLRISGIYLQPYMPNKAKQILDYLGVENSKREWQNAKIGSDSTYGNPLVPLGEGHEGVLFPPIPEA